jgi:hypothetical protein
MLELLMLWQLGKSIAARARKKGRSAARYVLLLLALWFIGEALGAAVCFVILAAFIGPDRAEGGIILIYPASIVGASVGAYLSFTIASREPWLRSPPEADPAMRRESL